MEILKRRGLFSGHFSLYTLLLLVTLKTHCLSQPSGWAEGCSGRQAEVLRTLQEDFLELQSAANTSREFLTNGENARISRPVANSLNKPSIYLIRLSVTEQNNSSEIIADHIRALSEVAIFFRRVLHCNRRSPSRSSHNEQLVDSILHNTNLILPSLTEYVRISGQADLMAMDPPNETRVLGRLTGSPWNCRYNDHVNYVLARDLIRLCDELRRHYTLRYVQKGCASL